MRIVGLIVALIFAFGCGDDAIVSENTKSPATDTVKETNIRNVSVQVAQAAVSEGKVQFIDVRTPQEFGETHAKNAKNIPLEILQSRLDGLNKEEPVYLICRTGSRSAMAAEILKEKGFTNIHNIKGGITDWISAKLPVETVSRSF